MKTGIGKWRATVALVTVAELLPVTGRLHALDYKDALFGPRSSLGLNVESVDKLSGVVRVNGGDSRRPTIPFQWDWGDGSKTSGFFPQSHTYLDRGTNYVLKVTAFYGGGQVGRAETVVYFQAPSLHPIHLPGDTTVTVPAFPVALGSRQPGYGFSPLLTSFSEADFPTLPRATVEYVLSVANAIQCSFANEDLIRPGGVFAQVVLRDPGGGFYSLWYATPAAFAAGNNALGVGVPWTSCFHEMGHNVTLNSPAAFHYGGKIDGNANAIISETLAQIFQHATAAELANRGSAYGLGKDLIWETWQSALSSMNIVRSGYESYLNQGRVFHSWNAPFTPNDETVETFMTIAYKFFEHAEQDGLGYRIPLKRLMRALQLFNFDWLARYAPADDTPSADSFRATLWVAALSHAFQRDLRAEFRDLAFPVSDSIYLELAAQTAPLSEVADRMSNAPSLTVPDTQSVNEETTLTVTNLAADVDIPANLLSFGLVEAPAGASLDPVNGVFTWTPTEDQGPGTNVITLRVTDDGTPSLSATNSFLVIVREVNRPPILSVVSDLLVEAGGIVAFTAEVNDPDFPANVITFSLNDGAPEGAGISAAGSFTWKPTKAQGGKSYALVITAADDGTPPLSDSKTLNVTVAAVQREIRLTEAHLSSNGSFSFAWSAQDGRSYQVQFKARLDDPEWLNLEPLITATGDNASYSVLVSNSGHGFYRVIGKP